MALHPDVQKRAQADIDALVGPDRLPDFDDSDHLPYIHAIMLEVLRWKPVVPFNTTHAVMEDDEYHGMFIPKGTVVIAVSLRQSSNGTSYSIRSTLEHMVRRRTTFAQSLLDAVFQDYASRR